MKKITYFLLCTVALLATGCQKESTQCRTMNTGIVMSDVSNDAICMTYSVDGVSHSVVLRGEDDLINMICSLTWLTTQGHIVVIGKGNVQANPAATKDVVTFETKEQKEMELWTMKMLLEGYSIEQYYDAERGVYVGIAVKE